MSAKKKSHRSRKAVNHTDAKGLPAKRTRNGSKRRTKKEGAALKVRVAARQARITEAIRALVAAPSPIQADPFPLGERPTLDACSPAGVATASGAVEEEPEGEYPRLVSFLDEATRRPWLIVAMAVAFAVLCALGIWCVS